MSLAKRHYNTGLLKAYSDFVQNLTELSKCDDKKVACIICNYDLHQLLSIGINGGPKGIDDLECLCSSESKYSCIHAEINALIKLNTHQADKVMICSLAPCMQCAAAIINEPGGFSAVLFKSLWKETAALQMLIEAGINVGRIAEDDSIEWLTNDAYCADSAAENKK